MTTAPERPVATVDDIEHPHWCDLNQCIPGPRDIDGEHFSRGTMWPSRADAAQTTVSLTHADDPDARTGKDHAKTLVLLDIHHTELPDETGVRLSPEEARMIAAALNRYADDAVIDNRVGGIRCTAAELREGKR